MLLGRLVVLIRARRRPELVGRVREVTARIHGLARLAIDDLHLETAFGRARRGRSKSNGEDAPELGEYQARKFLTSCLQSKLLDHRLGISPSRSADGLYQPTERANGAIKLGLRGRSGIVVGWVPQPLSTEQKQGKQQMWK